MNNNEFIKVSIKDSPVYEPEGHEHTYNRRLVGPFNGSEHLEFIVGEMHKGGGAKKHCHTELDQIIYMLEGELRIISPQQDETITPGDLVLFLKGIEHEVHCESELARFVVIYGPPKQ